MEILFVQSSFAFLDQKCNFLFSLSGPPSCDSLVDIAFLVDSSGSIGHIDYEREKDFIKRVAQRFSISPSHTRASIIVYSDSATIEARWDEYTNTEDFERAVDKLPYRASLSRIDKALKLAASDLFPKARPNANRIAVVITDGRLTSARDASEPLKKAGVRIVVLGVGASVDIRELRTMTESEEHVLRADDFTKVNLEVDKVVRIACPKNGM